MSSNPFAENKVKDQSFRFDRRIVNTRRLNPPPSMSFNDMVSHAITHIEHTLVNLQTEHERLKSELVKIKSKLVPEDVDLDTTSNIREMNSSSNIAIDSLAEMSTSVNELCTKYDDLSTDVANIKVSIHDPSVLNDLSTDVMNMKANMLKLAETLSEQVVNYESRMSTISESVKSNDASLSNFQQRISDLESTIENIMSSDEIQKYIDRLMSVEDSIPRLTANASQSDISLSNVKAQLADTDSFVDSMQSTFSNRIKQCSDTLSIVDSRVSTCETELSVLREEVASSIHDHEVEIKSLNDSIVSNDVVVRESIEQLNAELDKLKTSKQRDLVQQINYYTEHFDKLDQHIDDMVLKYEAISSDFNMHDLKIRDHSDNIEELLKTVDAWENCSNEFKNHIDSVEHNVSTLVESKVEESKSDLLRQITTLNEKFSDYVKKDVFDDAEIRFGESLTTLSANVNDQLPTFAKKESLDHAIESFEQRLTELSTNVNAQLPTFAKQTSLDTFSINVNDRFTSLLDTVSTLATQTSLDMLSTNVNNLSVNAKSFSDELSTCAKQWDLDMLSTKFQTLNTSFNKHLEKPHPFDSLITEGLPFGIPSDDISSYQIGMPLYMTVDGFVYDSIKKEFVPVNDVVHSNSFQSLSAPDDLQLSNMLVYPTLSTSGTWKEYVGICTVIDTDLNIIRYSNSGTYIVSNIPDTSNLGIGETLFIDPDGKIKILADNATVTTKMRRMILGTITAIINDHIVQVHK